MMRVVRGSGRVGLRLRSRTPTFPLLPHVPDKFLPDANKIKSQQGKKEGRKKGGREGEKFVRIKTLFIQDSYNQASFNLGRKDFVKIQGFRDSLPS